MREQCERIRMGMTHSQVKTVMGCAPMGHPPDPRDIGSPFPAIIDYDRWWDNQAIITIAYKNDVAIGLSFSPRDCPWRRWLRWLRQRLGL
jgi:hypothetical protein